MSNASKEHLASSQKLLAQVESELAELRAALEKASATVPGAQFDEQTGAPANREGEAVSCLSLVADELGEVVKTVERLRSRGEAPSSELPRSVRQARPRPLVWEGLVGSQESRLLDPAGHWHGRIFESHRWGWELAPGYNYGEALLVSPEVEDGERVAMESCERVLSLHGWPAVCLPTGVREEGGTSIFPGGPLTLGSG